MFGYKHYVPILKGKDGEFRALARLTPSVRRKITPFIDIPRVDYDINTNKPKDPIQVHLKRRQRNPKVLGHGPGNICGRLRPRFGFEDPQRKTFSRIPLLAAKNE